MGKISLKLLPLGALGIFLTKILITNTINLTDVLLIAILAALTVFYEAKGQNSEIKELKSQISSIQEDQKSQDKIIDDLKTQMASVKISTGLRGLGTR